MPYVTRAATTSDNGNDSEEPDPEPDHIDGDEASPRLAELRQLTLGTSPPALCTLNASPSSARSAIPSFRYARVR